VTGKSFKFPEQHDLPFFFVSAADGTNVVKVFEQAVEEAVRYRYAFGPSFRSSLLNTANTQSVKVCPSCIVFLCCA
jgi:Rab-like protein 2